MATKIEDIKSKKKKVVKKTTPKKKVTAKKPGRKKLPPEQKASETVTLKLTPAEKKIFDSKAGYVPPGTFLKNYLKENSDLLG